jgi:hypothetical protein
MANRDQITLNNVTVGRSVLEALRLLEAFQAVAKHGVLCPIDWRPSDNAQETLNTIANLQKEFGGLPVTDLDAKHRSRESSQEHSVDGEAEDSEPAKNLTPRPSMDIRQEANGIPSTIQEVTCQRPRQGISTHSARNDCLPQSPSSPPPTHRKSVDFIGRTSTSSPQNESHAPMSTPSSPNSPKLSDRQITARHARGTLLQTHCYINNLFSQAAPSNL